MEQHTVNDNHHLDNNDFIALNDSARSSASNTKHTTINNMSAFNDDNDDDNDIDNNNNDDAAFWNAAATFRNYYELFQENDILKLIGVIGNNENEEQEAKRQRRTKSVYSRQDQLESGFYKEYLQLYDKKGPDENIPLLDPKSPQGKTFCNFF